MVPPFRSRFLLYVTIENYHTSTDRKKTHYPVLHSGSTKSQKIAKTPEVTSQKKIILSFKKIYDSMRIFFQGRNPYVDISLAQLIVNLPGHKQKSISQANLQVGGVVLQFSYNPMPFTKRDNKKGAK